MIGYLSGPITGHTGYRQEFEAAAEELLALGYNVINPAELDRVIPLTGLGHEEIMKIDLVFLEKADYLVQLPGWEESRGANRELGFALGAGKIVVAYEDMLGGRCNDIDRDV